jgi:hypothetical protein
MYPASPYSRAKTAGDDLSMKITIHLGAHRTDQDRMMKTLMRNSARLSGFGTFVPGPSRYRTLLREVTQRLKGEVANPETLDLVLDALLDTTDAEHIVLSYEAFLCGAQAILADGGYYARAAQRVAGLCNVFPGHRVRFALALRNPATQIPEVYHALTDVRLSEFLGKVDPLACRWINPVRAMLAAVPDCQLIAWCNEDTPLIWGDVLRAVGDYPESTWLRGSNDLLSSIMTEEGWERMRSYLADHPPVDEDHRRRIYSAFLDKFAKPEAVEEEIDLPGWDQALVARITANYEADVEEIATLPGVKFLAP